MAPSNKTSFKTYEAQTRLLAAVIATNKGIKLDYKALAAHCGGGASASSVDHRLRPIKQLAKMQAKCVGDGEDPGNLPVEKSEIQKAYGESTPDGLEWQFRGIKRLGEAQKKALANDESPADLDVTKIVAGPSGGGGGGGRGGGTSTPRGRGGKASAVTTPQTGGSASSSSTMANTRTPGSRTSKASAPGRIPTPSYAGAAIFNKAPSSAGGGGGGGAATATSGGGHLKRPYRAISDDPDDSEYQDDDDDDDDGGEYMDQDETPTGRRKRQQARFPAAAKTAPVSGYNVGAPTSTTTSLFGGAGTSGGTLDADGGNIEGLNGSRANSSFFNDGSGHQFEVIDLAGDDVDDEVRGFVKDEPGLEMQQSQIQGQGQGQGQGYGQGQTQTAPDPATLGLEDLSASFSFDPSEYRYQAEQGHYARGISSDDFSLNGYDDYLDDGEA